MTHSKNCKLFIVLCFFFFLTSRAHSMEKLGRMGLGFNRQIITGIPSLSVKVQKSSTFALGGIFGVETNSETSNYAFGFKTYRIIFDEPHLNFYTSVLGAFIKSEVNNQSNSGYQFDLNLGSEFHIPGIESIGFSFEFGFSLNKLAGSTTVETTGYNFLLAGVHFYL